MKIKLELLNWIYVKCRFCKVNILFVDRTIENLIYNQPY